MVFSFFSAALSSSKISGPSMFVRERSRISRFEFPRTISLMNGTKISSDEKLIRCVETDSTLRGHFWLFFLKKFKNPARASIPLTSRNFKLGRFSTELFLEQSEGLHNHIDNSPEGQVFSNFRYFAVKK